MPRNRPFLLHLTFTYCFIFQSPEHLPTFLSIDVGLYDGKKDHSIPINWLVVVANFAIQTVLSEVNYIMKSPESYIWHLIFFSYRIIYFTYRISANIFRGNYSFLSLALCTVTFDLWSQYIKVWKLFKGGNYSRAETIRGNTVFKKLQIEKTKATFLYPF